MGPQNTNQAGQPSHPKHIQHLKLKVDEPPSETSSEEGLREVAEECEHVGMETARADAERNVARAMLEGKWMGGKYSPPARARFDADTRDQYRSHQTNNEPCPIQRRPHADPAKQPARRRTLKEHEEKVAQRQREQQELDGKHGVRKVLRRAGKTATDAFLGHQARSSGPEISGVIPGTFVRENLDDATRFDLISLGQAQARQKLMGANALLNEGNKARRILEAQHAEDREREADGISVRRDRLTSKLVETDWSDLPSRRFVQRGGYRHVLGGEIQEARQGRIVRARTTTVPGPRTLRRVEKQTNLQVEVREGDSPKSFARSYSKSDDGSIDVRVQGAQKTNERKVSLFPSSSTTPDPPQIPRKARLFPSTSTSPNLSETSDTVSFTDTSGESLFPPSCGEAYPFRDVGCELRNQVWGGEDEETTNEGYEDEATDLMEKLRIQREG